MRKICEAEPILQSLYVMRGEAIQYTVSPGKDQKCLGRDASLQMNVEFRFWQ
jgi:hypothetical protein